MQDVTSKRIEELKLKLPTSQTYGSAPKTFPKPNEKFNNWFFENSVKNSQVEGVPLGFVSCPLLYARAIPNNKTLHGQIIKSVLSGMTKIVYIDGCEYLIRN